MTGRVSVVPEDRRRRSGRGDPVVELRCRLGHPAGRVEAQLHAADGRVVPEEAVALAREQERDADLGVALDEVDDAALLVEPPVLMLAEAVEVLAVGRLEAHFELNRPPWQVRVAACGHGEAVDRHLAQQVPCRSRTFRNESAPASSRVTSISPFRSVAAVVGHVDRNGRQRRRPERGAR